MGKNRGKNKRKKEKHDQKEKERKQEEEDFSAQSGSQFVKENWYDEAEDGWEKVVGKKRPHVKQEILKNQHKQIESMEVDDIPPRKKINQMNNHRDSDHNMECGEEDCLENPFRGKDKSRESNRNHLSHRPEDSSYDHYGEDFYDRDSRNSSDYQRNYSEPNTKNRGKSKQLHVHQDSDQNTACAKKDWSGNSPLRKNNSRERNGRNDSRTRGVDYSPHRREGNSRHRHNDQNKTNNFNYKGSRNDSIYRSNYYPQKEYHPRNRVLKDPCYFQTDTQNEDNRHYHNDRSSRGANNRRNESTNNQPPYRRHQGQENQNSFEKGNRPYEERNTRQNGYLRRSQWDKTPQCDKQYENTFVKSKKKNKQPLFVFNADYYEPTIREKKGDLFESSEEYSLAHCVAEDLLMSAGIAIEFKKRFKGVDQLWQQNKRVGEVAILQRDNRFIFYLITKKQSYAKPTIDSIATAIKSLKKSCLELGVKKLAIPRIGCGLDRLDWDEVKNILYDEFSTTDIEIVVYVW